MTETTCPTCGAKCTRTKRPTCGAQICSVDEHNVQATPQPDLTMLRESYKKWIMFGGLLTTHDECLEVLLKVVKKVLGE